jgi:hypothetical protein
MVCLKSLGGLGDAVGAEVARRVAAGELSLSQLARECLCSEAHLSNWSRGRRRAGLSLLDVVMARLRLAPCEVLRCAGCAGLSKLVVPVASVVEPVAPVKPARRRRRPHHRRVDPLRVKLEPAA